MAPTTRALASTSTENNVDDSTKRYIDEALAGIRRGMEEILNQIAGISLQNQVVNEGGNRQQTQFSRLTKVEFLKFLGDDVRGWIFRFRAVFDDPMAQLRNVKYENSAKEYQDKFDDLLSRVEELRRETFTADVMLLPLGGVTWSLTTPFQAVYGQTPPIHVPYLGGLSKVDVMDRTLEAIEQAIQMVKFHLGRSQNRMKQHADKRGTDREFKVGDWEFLKLQLHRQASIRQEKQYKFSNKSFGPFKVISCGTYCHLGQKDVKKRNAVEVFGLVQWASGTIEDATWEPLAELCDKIPWSHLSSLKKELFLLNNGSMTLEQAASMFNVDMDTFKEMLKEKNILVWNEGSYPFKSVILIIEDDHKLSRGFYELSYKHSDTVGNVLIKTDIDCIIITCCVFSIYCCSDRPCLGGYCI
nr:reverse transcriptase [Tanacetum cinerariifolium]